MRWLPQLQCPPKPNSSGRTLQTQRTSHTYCKGVVGGGSCSPSGPWRGREHGQPRGEDAQSTEVQPWDQVGLLLRKERHGEKCEKWSSGLSQHGVDVMGEAQGLLSHTELHSELPCSPLQREQARQESQAYIDGHHVVLVGLAQLPHDLHLGVGAGLRAALHRDGALGVVDGQVLQPAPRENPGTRLCFFFESGKTPGKLKPQLGVTPETV